MKNLKYKKGIVSLVVLIAAGLSLVGGFLGYKAYQNEGENLGAGSGTISALPYRSKISSTDTTGDFLLSKLVAGSNITLTQNNVGGNETLTIASTGGGGGGTPCTTTALSIQYNNAGAFGCVSGVTSNGSNLTAKDANLEVVDDGDVTKKLKIQASTVTTGTTRTVTALNSDGVWALTNAAFSANKIPYSNSSGVFISSNALQYDPSTFTAQIGSNGVGTGVLNIVKSDGTLNVNLTSDEAADSWISSDLGIGKTSAAAKLDITGGTTSKAGLILSSGTNLTSPVSGAIENNGTNLFYTDSGPTRRTLVTTDNTQTLTNKTLTSPTIAKIANLTTNGFVKTSGGDGTLSIDTSTYLTGNQTITLSGDVSGSGSTAITTAIGNNKVTGAMIALGSDAQGDVMYYNGTDYVRLAAGTSGQYLQTQGAGANPQWATVSGGGGTPGGSSGNIQWNNGGSFAGISGSTVTSLGYITEAPTLSTSGAPTLFTLTGPAHTGLTASTEAIDVNYNLARTVQFATGAKTLQRAFVIQPPTYSAVGSTTISEADTFVVTGPPVAGTNVTITNPMVAKFGTPGAFSNTVAAFGGSLNGYFQLMMQNTSSGTLASSDFVAQADNSTNSTNYVDIGVTSSTFADTNFTLWGGADTGYVFNEGPQLTIATSRAGAPLVFGTGGTLAANERARMTDSTFALTPGVSTGSSSTAFKVTGSANTTVTASTNVPDIDFNLARTVQFATGAKTAQVAMALRAPTYSAVGSTTITDSATLYIDAGPTAGTNVTQTNRWALWIDANDARFDGNLRFNASGTTSNTNISVVGGENSGINLLGASGISVVTGGSTRWSITGTSITGSGSGALILRNDGGAGTATTPTYGSANDTNTGFGFDGSDVSYFTNGGVRSIEINASQNVGVGIAAASITAGLHLKASTTSAASLRIAAGTAPTSPNEGDMWGDSTQKSLYTYTDGIKQALAGTIFTQTANASVTATTTETTLLGSGTGTKTLPANFWTVGKTIRIKVTFRDIDTDAVPGTWTVRTKFGTTTVVSHGGTPTAAQTNGAGDAEILITCRTTGATGTLSGYIKTAYGYTGISTFVGTTTSTTTVDTTSSQALDVTMQFGNANAGNNITSLISTFEVLN